MGDDAALLALADTPEVKAWLRDPHTGLYIVRADGHIVWASPSMGEVTGRTPQQLVGQNGWDVFVPPENLAEVAHFRALLSDGDGVIWMPLRMSSGGRTWFQVDTILRRGGIVCAFRRETDPAQHHLHYAMRPRPRSA